MSYEKQTWECGEVITADKLNHIEDGIEAVENEIPTDTNQLTNGAGFLTIDDLPIYDGSVL